MPVSSPAVTWGDSQHPQPCRRAPAGEAGGTLGRIWSLCKELPSTPCSAVKTREPAKEGCVPARVPVYTHL